MCKFNSGKLTVETDADFAVDVKWFIKKRIKISKKCSSNCIDIEGNYLAG